LDEPHTPCRCRWAGHDGSLMEMDGLRGCFMHPRRWPACSLRVVSVLRASEEEREDAAGRAGQRTSKHRGRRAACQRLSSKWLYTEAVEEVAVVAGQSACLDSSVPTSAVAPHAARQPRPGGSGGVTDYSVRQARGALRQSIVARATPVRVVQRRPCRQVQDA
jgi:hypothetical protein